MIRREAGKLGLELNDAKCEIIYTDHIDIDFNFYPSIIAIETLGVPGDEALAFFHDLGQRIPVATCHSWTTFIQFLMQRLSVATQRGNAACIVGTMSSYAGWDELFYI